MEAQKTRAKEQHQTTKEGQEDLRRMAELTVKAWRMSGKPRCLRRQFDKDEVMRTMEYDHTTTKEKQQG